MSQTDEIDPRPIGCLSVFNHAGGREMYEVGQDGVKALELFTRPGLHSDIPYVRVIGYDHKLAEFCLHACTGIYFAVDQADLDKLVAIGQLAHQQRPQGS